MDIKNENFKTTPILKVPKKNQYSAIIEFEVLKPLIELETIGERLILSQFGEYCPNASLRGYSLEHLLTKPYNYRPKIIIQRGKKICLNY